MDALVRGREAVVAVVDALGDDVWIWWVNTSVDPDVNMDRKVGAWHVSGSAKEFPKLLDELLFQRMVLATESGRTMISAAQASEFRWIDPNATLKKVSDIRDEYQRLFDKEQSSRTKSKKMRDLLWPALPSPLDVENPPQARGQAEGVDVGRCLALSAWMETLVRTFREIEGTRLDRDSLRDLGPIRNFPAVTD